MHQVTGRPHNLPSTLLGLDIAYNTKVVFTTLFYRTAGYNYYGNLGDNAVNSAGESSPVAVVEFGSLTFTLVSAGYRHTCGIEQTTGAAWCWGDNSNSQLGLGFASGTYYIPTAMTGGYQFQHLQAGGDFTCGVLVNNSAVCWGERRCTLGGLGWNRVR